MSKTRSSQFYHPDDPEADAQMAPGNPAPLSTGQERAGMPDGYQPLGPITPGAPNAASMAQGQQRAGTPNYIDPNYRPAPLENQGPDIRMRTTGFLGGDTVQESRTAAGDPIYMPQTAVPLFELQSNLDEVRANKRQLADWWGKQADQFDGVAAPQYDKAYQQWALGEQDRYVQQWADAYFDGDRGKAARHLYEDPEAQRRYRSFLRDLNASGVANKYYTKQAIDYIDGVNAGTTYMDPELYKEAQWFASGAADFGQGGDGAAIRADHAKTWDRLSSRDKMFNTVYHPQLANALEKLASTGGITRDPSGRLIFTEEARSTWDGYKRQVAKEMTHLYGTGSEAENMRFLDARLPDQAERNVKALPVGGSGGSGSGGGGGGSAGGSLNYAYRAVTGHSGGPATHTDQKVDNVELLHESASKGKSVAPAEFYDRNTDSYVYMSPVSVFRGQGGKLFISGMVSKEPGTTRVDESNDGGMRFFSISTDAKGEKMEKEIPKEEYFNTLKPTIVPFDDNEGRLQGLFPKLDVSQAAIQRIMDAGRAKRQSRTDDTKRGNVAKEAASAAPKAAATQESMPWDDTYIK